MRKLFSLVRKQCNAGMHLMPRILQHSKHSDGVLFIGGFAKHHTIDRDNRIRGEYDPRFMQWAQSDDVDLDSTLNSLLRARTEDDVDRYAKIASRKIAQYNAQSKSQAGSNRSAPSGTDPNVRLTAGMRRGSVQRETDAQRDAKLAEARRLSRSSNLHDRNKAKAILESIS